ncbi:membrane fusion protein [Marinomonas alcarazii]|uniref:Membrane fusion protein n=1 Tax=Marinomonas alcarazii TaxID=491949 RepID=A0A318UT12_9GAMM|nr:HlyD family efflux transporter periplasmic adaptor subunit [Marinomonas alcarazii]PYF79602.1 membrane fusion protein [Marinomonas alcarazii]
MDKTNRQPNSSLFRQEVLHEKQRSHMGQVLIHQPANYVWVVLVAVLLVILVIAFVLFGIHTQKVRAPGILVPSQGVLRILAPVQGQVEEVKVREGQFVNAGDPLFTVADERVSSIGELQNLLAETLALRESLIKQDKEQAKVRFARQKKLFALRLSSMELEKSQFDVEIDLLERREGLAEKSLNRLRVLHDQRHVAEFELQNAEAELLVLASQKQSLIRSQSSLENNRLELIAQRQDQEEQYQRQMTDAEQRLALLQQEIAENTVRSKQIIQAPFSGKVTGLNIQAGQQVTINTLMASLVPQNSKLQADLYITPSQVGFIAIDQSVSLRYTAYPYQKFGMAQGRIMNIASSPYSLQELPTHIASILQNTVVTQNQAQNFYKVTVAINSQHHGYSQPLLPGMQLEADIKQDTRRIYEWILDPIYSVVRKI